MVDGVTVRTMTKSAFIRIMSRILSCFSAFIILYFEMYASMGNNKVLFGVMNDVEKSLKYESYLIFDFVKELLKDPEGIKTRIEGVEDDVNIIYLDELENIWTLGSACQNKSTSDHLYEVNYLTELLDHALVDVSVNVSAHWIVVDCTYDGRVNLDTSCIKAHLLDKHLRNFYTTVIQTLSVTRNAHRLLLNGVVAITGNLSLLSAQVASNTITTTENNASYFVSLSFNILEKEKFVAINLEDFDPPDGIWRGRIKNTEESLLLVGTEGIYRTSPNTQGVFKTYTWALPTNPVEYIGVIQFLDRYMMKDIWGWFRCFLELGIGTNIGMNFFVAILVMKNVWKKHRVLWIPDIYPAIQKRAAARALLLLLDCMINSWWYPMMYAINQGDFRRKRLGSCFMSEIPRADGLMICLGITYCLARMLNVRVRLYVVVSIYCVCFFMRIAIIQDYGLFIDYANAELDARYLENIITSDDGVDLWAFHEDHRVDYRLLANELTWLLWAVFASAVCVIIVKVASCRIRLKIQTASYQVGIKSFASSHRHWSSRSRLYTDLTIADLENTRTERSVGKIAGKICGFVAFSHNYVAQVVSTTSTPKLFVSMSGVWLLGYVIVDDRYLLNINDYAFLLINFLLKSSIFHVHGYLLKGNIIAMDEVRIYHDDIGFQGILHASLKPLD